jgi:hypothetical protein
MNPVMPWKRQVSVESLTIGGEAEPPRPVPSGSAVPAQAEAKPLRAIVIALAVSAGLWALIAHFL